MGVLYISVHNTKPIMVIHVYIFFLNAILFFKYIFI
jgi:hypothetical protein